MYSVPLALSPRRQLALTVFVTAALVGIEVAQLMMGDRIAIWRVALPFVALLAWMTSLRRAAAVVAFVMACSVVLAAILEPPFPQQYLWYVDLSLRTGVMLLTVILAAGWRRNIVRTHQVTRADPRTGLVNSREFFRVVDAELHRALRYERPFTVVYVCLEGFTEAERHGGRTAGTRLLQVAGEAVTGAMRVPDTVAWLRGGELAVLMPETGPAVAQTALARMRDALDLELRRHKLEPDVAIGAVTWIRTDITVDQLLQRTYQMMYAAQREQDHYRHEVLDTADVVL